MMPLIQSTFLKRALARLEEYKNIDDLWTVGRNSKGTFQHRKSAISAQEISDRLKVIHDDTSPMTIEHQTTIKDIILVNQLLHSLTAKDKENVSTVKRSLE